MSKTITVDVECDETHCEDHTRLSCPNRAWEDDALADLDERIAKVFRQHGPADERLCDWRKCMEQPWRALAEALMAADGVRP